MAGEQFDRFWANVLREIAPRRHVELLRRVELSTTADGRNRMDRTFGTLATEALPVLDPENVGATTGSGFDTAADQLDAAAATFAPIAATFVVQTPNPALTNEQALSALATGLVKVTTGTGVLSTATANTDYAPVASPTFTGTVTAVDLSTTGNATLGNGDADVELLQGHVRHKSAAPTIAVGAALGTGGSVGATINGSDQAGYFDLTAGTTSLTTGTLASITFASARPSSSAYAVVVSPRSTTAGVNAIQAYLARVSASVWDIRCNVAPTSGALLQYMFLVAEWTN